jgi:hypothetical protein
VAQSLTETLTEAARAAAEESDWERDREAWNLPRAHAGTIDQEPDEDDVDVADTGPEKRRSDPPATPPRSTE